MSEEPKEQKHSLSTKAARNLATTTKTVPQMEAITPRWLLQLLPWVQVESGTYRVNRRKLEFTHDERVRVTKSGEKYSIEPENLRAVSLFRNVEQKTLESLAINLKSLRIDSDEKIMSEGDVADKFYILARGKVEVYTTGAQKIKLRVAILSEGDFFGEIALHEDTTRNATVQTLTPCVLFTLDRSSFNKIMKGSAALRENLKCAIDKRCEKIDHINESGESSIDIKSGHSGEEALPDTFVDYSEEPEEYPLSVVQTVLKVHTRVSDLYNEPINQLKEQLRLTIQGIKERQEWEIINNKEFGLLNSTAPHMRVQPKTGTPTPDDMDEMLAKVWKKPGFFLAHPKAIAAFGRECTRRGVPPPTSMMFGSPFLTWRGVPIVPCDKLMVNGKTSTRQSFGMTNILLMRVGEHEQGVVGLHNSGIPGEVSDSLSVRLMGIDNSAVASYLLTLYFSAAVLTADSLAVMENVDVGFYHEYKWL